MQRGLTPDLVLCSTATRTRETWERAHAVGATAGEVRLVRGIYHAWVPELVRLLRQTPDEVATVLLQLLAPVMSFTAEEAWQFLPGQKAESIFLTDFPEPAVKPDEALTERYAKLFAVRGAVQGLLEAARREYQQEYARGNASARSMIEEIDRRLKRGHEYLDDLERQASYAGVPRDWRR